MFSKVRRYISGLFGSLSRFLGGVPKPTLETKVKALKALYTEFDEEVEDFQRQVGLVCPEHCGHCCEFPRIETSEFEMLPMAFDLVRRGEVDRFYEAADKLDFDGRCVFFESDPVHIGRGRCRRYELRPTVCRLFSFSGNYDKYGQTRLVVCGIIKSADPVGVEKAVKAVTAREIKPPVMADYIMRVSGIKPELAREQFPINLALKHAVDRVWLYQKFCK